MTTTGATRHTRYDRRMFAVMNNPRAGALHATAARRRTAVGAHVVLTAAGVAAGTGAYASDRPWPAVAVLVLLVPWCLATGVINGATRGLLELRTHVLDERRRSERDRVRARAHRLMGATGSGNARSSVPPRPTGAVRYAPGPCSSPSWPRSSSRTG